MIWNLISKDKVLEEIDAQIKLEKRMVDQSTNIDSKLMHDYTLSILRPLRKRIADMCDE